jgi:Carboxypeptidase regulatory-like domain
MQRPKPWGLVGVVTAWLPLVMCGAVFARSETGNVNGRVIDEKGAALPGATVTVETPAGKEVRITDARGRFSVLGLPPGKPLTLRTELEGYWPVEYAKLAVTAGRNTTVEITMAAAIYSDPVFSTEEALPDPLQGARAVTIVQEELQGIPTSRDPWALPQSAPGVQVDRVNVGGGDSGSQPVHVGPGASRANSTWAVDGVVVTDMAALGSSPATCDFDALEEVEITTGGTDAAMAVGGVSVNLVTRRGTNDWRGSARYWNTPSATQSSSSVRGTRLAPDEPSTLDSSTRVRGIDDFGGEAGGPLVRDRLWLWGWYGEQKISTLATGGIPASARLPTWGGRLNLMIGASNSLEVFALQSEPSVAGLDASPTRPLATAWDQRRLGSSPTVASAMDTQILDPSFYLVGRLSEVNAGFRLTPIGGVASTAYLDPDDVWHHGFLDEATTRPQRQGTLDGNAFFGFLDNAAVSNELKFGAAYRRVTTTSLASWGGAGWILDAAFRGAPAGHNLLYAARAASLDAANDYTGGYVQDTLISGKLTATIGVRYDLQQGRNDPSAAPAAPAAPVLLPAYRFPGGGAGVSWRSFAPRLGIDELFGKDLRTLLRASYSRFADQLGAGTVAFTNPLAVQSYYYFVTPQTGPGRPTILAPAGLGYSGNVNPATGLPIVNDAMDRHLSAGLTDESLINVEHAVSDHTLLALQLTYRRLSRLVEQDLLVFDCAGAAPGCAGDVSSVGRRAARGDYVPVTVAAALPGGGVVPVTFYTLQPGLFTRGGTILVNGDRTQTYQAATVALTRRFFGRWMLRGSFTIDNWRWGHTGNLPDPTEGPAGGARDGDPVLAPSGAGAGPEAYVYIGARWAGSLDALYRVMAERPWGFDVAGNFTARQGYPLPSYVSQPIDPYGNYAGAPREPVLAAASPASIRLANVYDVDLRIGKEFSFQAWSLGLMVDCFNVLGSSTVLQRVAFLGTAPRSPGAGGSVYETMSPRIFRFGARVKFP